jgi:hypothetical protein
MQSKKRRQLVTEIVINSVKQRLQIKLEMPEILKVTEGKYNRF